MSADIDAALETRGDLPPHVIDSLPMPVVLSRAPDDVVVQVNMEYTAAYGLDEQAGTGRPCRDLHWVAEDRDLTLERHRKGLRESVEVRIRTGAGECRWAQADVSIFEYRGEPVYMTTFYDIGRRKEAELELDTTTASIREMARFPEMNPGPVARLRTDGTILRANAAALEIFALDAHEGLCFWDLVPDLDEAARCRVLDAGAPTRQDVLVGDTWLALTLTYEPASEQIFVYGTDISAQKAAEQELSERARFPQMNPGPVARLRRDGTVYRANPAAGRAFGRESIQDESFRELCRSVTDDLWNQVLTSGEAVRHEAEVGDRWFSFTLVYEPDSDQVFAYGSDVTELKAAQTALAELARFPDMNPGPVLRLDRHGDILLANRAALRLFGAEDLTGRSWLSLCPGADGPFWERVRGASEPIPLEAKIGTRHFMLHHAPGPEGAFTFVYGSDLTAQKNAEGALRQSEKMATLGTLTAGMAHELNNPAAAAQRAAEQLEMAFADLEEAHLAPRGVGLGKDGDRLLEDLSNHARDAAAHPIELGALERADRESEVEEWLEQQGVASPWDFAPSLVDIGHTVAGLEELLDGGAGDHVGLIVAWQAQAHRVYRLADEIRHGSGRLLEIVGAMKAYAYLGQAPLQSVNVNEGLKNTLVILRGKMKNGTCQRQWDTLRD